VVLTFFLLLMLLSTIISYPGPAPRSPGDAFFVLLLLTRVISAALAISLIAFIQRLVGFGRSRRGRLLFCGAALGLAAAYLLLFIQSYRAGAYFTPTNRTFDLCDVLLYLSLPYPIVLFFARYRRIEDRMLRNITRTIIVMMVLFTPFIILDDFNPSISLTMDAPAVVQVRFLFYPLLAVPLFIMAASMMNGAGITGRLFDFSRLIVGRMKGGLAHVNMVAGLIFAGISGAALADIGGLGNMEIKAMREQGYPEDTSAAITCASATVGPIFPPSIPLIIYGAAAEISAVRLLIAGIFPALVITAVMMVQISFFARKYAYPRGIEGKLTAAELWYVVKRGAPAVVMPAFMMIGMLSGLFSPTEVAAIAVVYAMALSLCYTEMSWKRFIEVGKDTVKSSASVLFIVAAAAVFAWVLTVEQMPQRVSAMMLTISKSPAVLLLLTNVILLIAGMFLESTAAIMILTPILLPPLMAVGVDPVHIGVMLVFNLMIGMITPPVGMSVYMLSSIMRRPVAGIFRACFPWLLPLLIALAIITYVPQITLWLPNLLFG
jgi:tripartite ATP-independent transporter DctM subunit